MAGPNWLSNENCESIVWLGEHASLVAAGFEASAAKGVVQGACESAESACYIRSLLICRTQVYHT